jgi:hypothetical protein
MTYKVLKSSQRTALRASTVEIAKRRMQGPLPILTSRDMKAIERCPEHINGNPNFEDYDVYAKVSTVSQMTTKRRSVVDYSQIDEATKRKDLIEQLKVDLSNAPAQIKTWHAQIEQVSLTVKRREALFDISLEAGANLVEGRMLDGEKVDDFVKWLDRRKAALNRDQTITPTLPARLHPTVFNDASDKLIAQGYSTITMIGAPISEVHPAMNYDLIKQTYAAKAFIIAAEVTNTNRKKKGETAGPTPFKGMELIRDYGIGAFIPRINNPPPDDYTTQKARRLDNLGGGFEKLNALEYEERYHSLDLGCTCCACAEKDAKEFYGLYRYKDTYSALDALHTANVLPPLVRDLRSSLGSEHS